MKHLAMLVLASCLACASSKAQTRYPAAGTPGVMLTPEQQIAVAAGKGVDIDSVKICEYERTTGSLIPEWTCRYLDDKERDRFAAQKYLLQPPVSSRPTTGGR